MGLAQIKRDMAIARAAKGAGGGPILDSSGVHILRKNTPVKLATQVEPAHVPEPTPAPAPVAPQRNIPGRNIPKVMKPKIERAQAEAILHGGESVLSKPMPAGYRALSKNDIEELLAYRDYIINVAKIFSFDYETGKDEDNEDDTEDPQDSFLVGVSFTHIFGSAVYLPIAHDNYAANWNLDWLVQHFLKPILEHPDVYVIAHNIKFEHQVSLLHGINMLPKAFNRMVMDTMLMVKALAHPDTVAPDGDKGWRVVVGLKPNIKTFLADKQTGRINNVVSIEDLRTYKETVGKKKVPIEGEFYKSGNKAKGTKKGDQKYTEVQRTFNELPIDERTVTYGCLDSDGALGVFNILKPVLEAEGLMDVLYELDVPNMMITGEIELAGWHINRKSLEGLRVVAEDALAKIMPDLNSALAEVTTGHVNYDDDTGEIVVPAGFYGMGTWRGNPVALEIKNARPFNWNSNQHQPWLFYHVLKVDQRGLERSKTTGIPSCGKENMDKIIDNYAGDSQFMKLLKEKKKYDKILSTYVEGLLPYCRQDTGKIHTGLNLVATWRYSSKKPNLW